MESIDICAYEMLHIDYQNIWNMALGQSNEFESTESVLFCFVLANSAKFNEYVYQKSSPFEN